MRTARAADPDTNMVRSKVFAGELTTALVESGRQHHVTMICIFIRVCKAFSIAVSTFRGQK
jgi:hypothetical protein